METYSSDFWSTFDVVVAVVVVVDSRLALLVLLSDTINDPSSSSSRLSASIVFWSSFSLQTLHFDCFFLPDLSSLMIVVRDCEIIEWGERLETRAERDCVTSTGERKQERFWASSSSTNNKINNHNDWLGSYVGYIPLYLGGWYLMITMVLY